MSLGILALMRCKFRKELKTKS